MKRNNKKGFTIVELVIVIAVIAILSAVLIPTFGGIISDANKSAVQQAARNAYTELYAYDLSQDQVLDGDKPATGFEKVTTYTWTDGVVNFVYNDTTKGFTATYDGTTWTVSENN